MHYTVTDQRQQPTLQRRAGNIALCKEENWADKELDKEEGGNKEGDKKNAGNLDEEIYKCLNRD